MTPTRLTRAGRWAAAELLERLPLVLLGDGSPLIAATAIVTGLLSAWSALHGVTHPALLTRHAGRLELYLWVACLFVGAAAILWGLVSRQWRVQVAGLMLAGSGLTVYGIAFAVSAPADSAAVGVPPIVLGVGAAIRIVIITAIGVTFEARNGRNGEGGAEADVGD